MNLPGRKLALVAFVIVIALFASTAARDILWGHGLELCVAAVSGGVPHPPGYPFYIWVAQICARIFSGFEIYPLLAQLNVLIGTGAACMAGHVCAEFLAREKRPMLLTMASWLPAVTMLVVGTSLGLWSASTLVEVYAMNALLSASFLAVMCVPAREGQTLRLALGGVLLGLMASHHLPSIAFGLLWVLRVWESRGEPNARRWTIVGAGAGLLLPVVLYGSLILRQRGMYEGLYWGGTDSLATLITHVRGGEYGQFLLLQEFPGRAFTFASWTKFAAHRIAEIFALADAQFGLGGKWITALALLAALYAGARALWKSDRPLLIGSFAAGLAHIIFLLLYNIADFEDYMLGVFVAFFPIALAGVFVALECAAEKLGYANMPERTSRLALPGIVVAVLAVSGNVAECSRVGEDLPRKWLENTLAALPPDAALLTDADNDTYAMWYAQLVEKRRRDVLVYATNFHRFPWFARTMPAENPRHTLVSFTDGPPPRGVTEYLATLHRLAIAPLLGNAPVYATLPNGEVLRGWQSAYDVRPVAQVLSDEDVQYLVERGQLGGIYPVILEIRKQDSE